MILGEPRERSVLARASSETQHLSARTMQQASDGLPNEAAGPCDPSRSGWHDFRIRISRWRDNLRGPDWRPKEAGAREGSGRRLRLQETSWLAGVAMSNKVSDHYARDGARYTAERQSDPSHLGYQLNLEFFLPHLKQTDRVLDFGCGNGGMLRLLPAHVSGATGLEVNPHSRALASTGGLEVFGDIDQLPNSAFDVIISNHVLEHIRDVATTLERLRGKLHAGGRLLLKLPLDDWRATNQRAPSAADIDHHLHTWTPLLLGNTLKEAGFVVDECQVITSAWHPKLFPLARLGLGKPAFWAFAAVMKRRQIFARAHVAPTSR